MAMGRRLVVTSGLVAVVVGVTGCGVPLRADPGSSASTASAPASTRASTPATTVTASAIVVSQPLPADFPKGIPLPSAPLLVATGRATPDGAGLWLLTYGGPDPDSLARSEGTALQHAGFSVTGDPVHATGFDHKRALTTIDVMTDGTNVTITVSVMAPLDIPPLG
jgi:hypothetical protein